VVEELDHRSGEPAMCALNHDLGPVPPRDAEQALDDVVLEPLAEHPRRHPSTTE
jgi:hypothetical protein